MKNHEGFTLIELIIVIVILGVLAAFAIPKYMNIDKEARISVVKGMKGSVHAAAEMVHAIAVSQGKAAGSTVNIGDATITLDANCVYPAATSAGIVAAIADTSGFDTATAGVFKKTGAPTPANCAVSYTITNNIPVITLVDATLTGC